MMDRVQEAGFLALPQLGRGYTQRVPILALGGRTNLEGLWLGQVQKGVYKRAEGKQLLPKEDHHS